MVKALILALFALTTMCTYGSKAAPSPLLMHSKQRRPSSPTAQSAHRHERSTNLSHVAGTARKIHMFIKNRHLQILPDGTANGTTDDTSPYTILQRTTIGVGRIKIQGVATCQYLCMDSCGLLYGSREFLDECVFHETIEQHHYNTYSSYRYSNAHRTLYMALNRRGQSRKVLIRHRQKLGRLSSYARVLTRTVPSELVNELPHHPLRHQHAHMCARAHAESGNRRSKNAAPKPASRPTVESTAPCHKRKRRKKKKRKCPPPHDTIDTDPVAIDACHYPSKPLKVSPMSNSSTPKPSPSPPPPHPQPHGNHCDMIAPRDADASDDDAIDCQREPLPIPRKTTKGGGPKKVPLSRGKTRKLASSSLHPPLQPLSSPSPTTISTSATSTIITLDGEYSSTAFADTTDVPMMTTTISPWDWTEALTAPITTTPTTSYPSPDTTTTMPLANAGPTSG